MRAPSLKWACTPSKTPTPNLAASKISIFETTISSGSVKLHGRQLQNRFPGSPPHPFLQFFLHFSLGHLPAASELPTILNSWSWRLKYDISKPLGELTTQSSESKFPSRTYQNPGRGWGSQLNLFHYANVDILPKAQGIPSTDCQAWLLCHILTA